MRPVITAGQVRRSLNMPSDVKAQLDHISDEHGMPLPAVVRSLLRRWSDSTSAQRVSAIRNRDK